MIKVRKLTKVLLLVSVLAFTGCGSEKKSSTIDDSKKSVSEEVKKDTVEEKNDPVDEEKNKTEDEIPNIVSHGDEKSVWGSYKAVAADGYFMYLSYNCDNDEYQASIIRNVGGFTCTGTYTYKDGYVTMKARGLDPEESDQTYDLVFYTDENKKLVFDETKSIDLGKIPDGILFVNDELKSNFAFTFEKEYKLDDIIGSDKYYRTKVNENAVAQDDITGDYEAVVSDFDTTPEIIPTISLTKDGEEYQIVLKKSYETKGKASYSDGMLVLTFEDNDTNLNITRDRHLCFYTDKDGKIVLDGEQSDDLMKVNLGLPWQFLVQHEAKFEKKN